MDYLYICKKGTTMWNEMSNPAVLMRIGQRIKETRIRQHITQEELATASGVSPLTVANDREGQIGIDCCCSSAYSARSACWRTWSNWYRKYRVSPIELKKLQGRNATVYAI